jgi:hypothetical protein
VFIGSWDGKYSCTWAEFKKLADAEYSEGYGWQHVNEALVVLFSDMKHLRRLEYDGAEWWQLDCPPASEWKDAPLPIVSLLSWSFNESEDFGA